MKLDEKKCPSCAEVIKKAALVCKHCGQQFSPESVRRAKADDTKNSIGALVLLAVVAMVVLTMCSGSDKEDPKKAAAEAAKAAEDKRKGFHCLSPWDGSSRKFVDAVKEQLRDPDSFEHDGTRIAPVDKNGQHAIVMSYRAKNGFGGVNRSEAVGLIDHESCDATVVSADSGN